MFKLFRTIWAWLNRHKLAAWIGAIGAFLSGVAAFGTWIGHLEEGLTKHAERELPPIASPEPGEPPSYNPFDALAGDKAAREALPKSLEGTKARLTLGLNAPLDIGSSPPSWKRTTIYDFAYAVDYFDQGDGTKRTFYVSCVGRMYLSICKESAKYREINHIHYNDWLQMPR